MSKVILALCLLLAAVILVASIDTEEFDSDNMMVSSYDKCTRLPLFLKCPKLTI
jgi:hypothetical protein